MRRTLTWLVTLPFAAASVLIGHAIAYRAFGLPTAELHGYLEHAPQIVLVLVTLALLGLAADARSRRGSPAPLASLAIVAFVTQEHVERLIHTGDVPFLLASPVLWLGIVLQLPLAIAIWVVARRLAEEIAASGRGSVPRIAWFPLALASSPGKPGAAAVPAAHPARGPPITA